MYNAESFNEALEVAARWAVNDAAHGSPCTVHVLEDTRDGDLSYWAAMPEAWSRKPWLRRVLSVRS